MVVVGRLGRPFGVRGELACHPTALGAAAFELGRTYALGVEPSARTLRCRAVRRHHHKLLLAFDGIDSPEAARELTNAPLYAERAAADLAPGEYLDADLIGMRLLDERGVELGRVGAVLHYPAQDCLVIEPQRGLVPLVKAFVRGIDLEGRTIATTLPEGLLEGS